MNLEIKAPTALSSHQVKSDHIENISLFKNAILPPDQIIPNCQEATDAIIAMVAEARELNQI